MSDISEPKSANMNTLQRIIKNTGVFFAAQVVTYLIAFLYTIYTAQYLGAEGFGILTSGLAFTLIFGTFADLGLSPLTVREVSRDKSLHSRYTGNIILIKLLLSIVTFVFMVAIINIQTNAPLMIGVVYILALWVVVNSFSQLFYSVFQAYEKMEYQSISSIINSVILLLGVIYGVHLGLGVLWFAFIYLLASTVVLVYCSYIYLTKFKKPIFEADWQFWKLTIVAALPLSIASIFSIIAFRVDTVLLSIIQGPTAVGWYGAAYKLIESLMFVPMVYTSAIFPVLSNFHISSQESLKLLYKKSVKYLTMLGLPIAAGTTIFAQNIIIFLYGSSYYPAVIALQILIWTIPFLFLTYIFSTLFISINKQNVILKITFIAMIFNVIANLLLIPKYSYIAAASLTVLTELLGAVLCLRYLSKYVCPIQFRTIFKPVLATSIMSLFLIMVPLNIYISIVLAAFIYLGLLISLKAFSPDDYEFIKKLSPKEMLK